MKNLIMIIVAFLATLIFNGCASDGAVLAQNRAIVAVSQAKIAAAAQLDNAMGGDGTLQAALYNKNRVSNGMEPTRLRIVDLFRRGGNLANAMQKYGVCQVNPGAHPLSNRLLRGQHWGTRDEFFVITMNGGRKTCVTTGDNIAFSGKKASHYRFCGNRISRAVRIRDAVGAGPSFEQVLAVASMQTGTPAMTWLEKAGLKVVPTFNVGVQYRINPDRFNISATGGAGGSATSSSSSNSSSSSSSSSTTTGGNSRPDHDGGTPSGGHHDYDGGTPTNPSPTPPSHRGDGDGGTGI